MDSILSELDTLSKEIITLLTEPKKIHYLQTLLISHITFLTSELGSKGFKLKKTLNNIPDAFKGVKRSIQTLTKQRFFDDFGGYISNRKDIQDAIDEINHIYQLIMPILSASEKIPDKIAFDTHEMSIIDELIKKLQNAMKFTFVKKIKHEFTYILIALSYEDEEIKDEEEKTDKNAFSLSQAEFRAYYKTFAAKLYIEDSHEETIKKPKISMKDIDNYFKEFTIKSRRQIILKLINSLSKNESIIKMYNGFYVIDDSEPMPLKTMDCMRFGRKVKENTFNVDYFLDGNISRKQFEIQFKDDRTTVKCLAGANNLTEFLIDKKKFPLKTFSIITFGEDDVFYVRETDSNPIENSSIPFKGGPYLALKGIGESSEYGSKKILIKTENSKVNEKKDNYDFIKTIKNSLIFGKDIKIKENEKNRGKIGYNEEIGWYIEGFALDDERFWEFPVKVAVCSFDDTKQGQCKPVDLEVGHIIHIEDYSFLVQKIN